MIQVGVVSVHHPYVVNAVDLEHQITNFVLAVNVPTGMNVMQINLNDTLHKDLL